MKDEMVTQPPHYLGTGVKGLTLEAITVIQAFDLGYYTGNAVKYILRHGRKGGETDALRDIDKAIQYLRMYREQLSENSSV